MTPENQACCACSRVTYQPKSHDDGTMSEYWACDSCGTQFIKKFWLQRELTAAVEAALEGAAKQVCGGCMAGDPIPVATEHQNMDSMGFYPCKAIGILTMIDPIRREPAGGGK